MCLNVECMQFTCDLVYRKYVWYIERKDNDTATERNETKTNKD